MGVHSNETENPPTDNEGKVDQTIDSSTVNPQDLDASDLYIGDAPIVLKDRYGFFVTDEYHRINSSIPSALQEKRRRKEQSRTAKWLKMKFKWGIHFITGSQQSIKVSVKLRRRVRKGIPDAMRGFAWYEFSGASAIAERYPNPVAIDISVVPETVLDEIDRDIDRTFPRHAMFIEKDGPGQQSLRRLLRWYAAIDLEVAYCQGMGFPAALLLTYLPEESAFHVLTAALSRPSCPLRELYLPGLVVMQKMLFVLDRLVARHLPTLHDHLVNEGIHPTMYFTEWVMALFCRGFPFDLVTRLWDALLLEGRWKEIYRLSLALLSSVKEQILQLRFDKVLAFLRELPKRIDSSAVADAAWTLPLKTADIEIAEQEYEEDSLKADQP